jgi:hypothetical protein
MFAVRTGKGSSQATLRFFYMSLSLRLLFALVGGQINAMAFT